MLPRRPSLVRFVRRLLNLQFLIYSFFSPPSLLARLILNDEEIVGASSEGSLGIIEVRELLLFGAADGLLNVELIFIQGE